MAQSLTSSASPLPPARGLLLADGHTHIQKSPLCEEIKVARRAGVDTIVVCATHRGDWDATRALAARAATSSSSATSTSPPPAGAGEACGAEPPASRVVPSYGVHPWWAGEAIAANSAPTNAAAGSAAGSASSSPSSLSPPAIAPLLRDLRSYLLDDDASAVGEIGLDRSKRGLAASPWEEAQVPLFYAQASLAAELGRAMSIHCVQAQAQLVDLLPRAVEEGRKRRSESAGEREADGWVGGILLHSWAGAPGIAAQLLAHKSLAGIPIVFSFVGGIATSVSNEFVLARSASSSSSTTSALAAAAAPSEAAGAEGGGAGEDKGAPPHLPPHVSLPRGAGSDALKCLVRLPHSLLTFETDSPDQSFLHTLSPAYIAWVERVMGWEGTNVVAAGQHRGADGGVTAVAGEKEAKKKHDADSSPACCPPPSSSSSSSFSTLAPNSPSLLPHIVAAAAIWRVAHRSVPEGFPLVQQGGGKAKQHPHKQASSAAGAPPPPPLPVALEEGAARFSFLARDDLDSTSPLVAAIRAEYAALAQASAANVRRVFGIVG